jgi:predicted MFS family arabinose efflux permease
MTNTRAGTTVAATQQFLHIVAVCVGCGLAHVGTSTMPFQIGALVDGTQRSASEAGLFGFIQVGALAAGMILISAWVDRIAPRRIAVGSCLLAALANMGLYFFHLLPLQLVFAALAGLGYGFVFAATVSGAAATREPDRVYAIGNGGALLIVVCLMAILPIAGASFGALGIFAALAGLALVSSPCFVGFKAGRRTEETRLAVWRVPGAPGLLIAWAAFSTGTGALYAFSERIGQSIHLPPAQIALVLSAGVFVGLIGTGVAALLGRRVNRPWALIIGMSGSGCACLLLGFAANLPVFAAGVFVYWVLYMFLYSYLLGTAAVLDPAGRVGTLGGGVERLGYGVGAGVGGILAEHATYSSTGVLGFLGCALGLALGFPSLFRVLKIRSAGSVQSSPATILAP